MERQWIIIEWSSFPKIKEKFANKELNTETLQELHNTGEVLAVMAGTKFEGIDLSLPGVRFKFTKQLISG